MEIKKQASLETRNIIVLAPKLGLSGCSRRRGAALLPGGGLVEVRAVSQTWGEAAAYYFTSTHSGVRPMPGMLVSSQTHSDPVPVVLLE